MSINAYLTIAFLISLLIGSIFASGGIAQSSLVNSRTELRLVDEFGPRLGSEERSARFDAFFSELGFYSEPNQNNGSVGHILVYCGKVCRYGEVEAHIRGIELKINTRQVPRNRFRIIAAGFRDDLAIELWAASDDKAAPVPRPTLNIKHVTFTKPTRRIVEDYDCCDDNGYLWRSFKP